MSERIRKINHKGESQSFDYQKLIDLSKTKKQFQIDPEKVSLKLRALENILNNM